MKQLTFVIKIIVLFLIIFFTQKNFTLAATITLSEFSPASITASDQEVNVKVQLSIKSDDGTIYYLRGVFSKDDTSNYCGYTWNGGEWFSGPYSTDENWKKFPSVTISSSSATTMLKAKLNTTDSGCKESGNYKFKIQRFTVSGSGSYDDQNIQSLTVTLPTLTPTPNPTNTPAPASTSAPTSTPKAPTSTPKPTIKTSPTSLLTIYSDDEGLDSDSGSKSSGSDEPVDADVLGESVETEEASKSAVSGSSPFLIVWILIGAGIVCMGVSAVVFYKNLKKQQKPEIKAK